MRTRPKPQLSSALDDKLYMALMDVVGQDLAFAAVDAVERVLCAPPPDVYDWYRRTGSWPSPGEA